MLLALTIFAIVLTAAWGAFGHLLNSTKGNHQQLLQSHALSNLYLQLRKDLQAIERRVVLESNTKGLPRTAPAIRLRKNTNDPCAASLEMETRSYLFPYRSIQDQAIRVKYWLENDGPSIKAIKRSVSHINQEKEAAPLSPTIVPTVVCWTLAIRDSQGTIHRNWPPGGKLAQGPQPTQFQLDIQTAQKRDEAPIRMTVSIADGTSDESWSPR